MKKIFRILSVFIVLMMAYTASNASHQAAVDIFYEYMAPLQYKVHLVIYRDCTGIGQGTSEYMTASSISCGQNFGFTVDTATAADPQNFAFVDDLCSNVPSTCINPSSQFNGYQYCHYAGIVNLPMACTDWVFNWNGCCRNIGITNIPANGTCINATLNNVTRPINSSAKLTIRPIPYVCYNQPTLYLNGPIDPDLDSVVFSASYPQDWGGGGCTPYTFNASYSVNNPVNAPGGYVVDPQTGTAAFTPTVTGFYVLAFTAKEYDKQTGVEVGSVMRDVQINVLNCNSAPPLVQPITNLQGAIMLSPNPVVLTVCPGQPMSFDIQATSQTVSNLVKTYGNNAASCPGSTYTSTPLAGGNPVTGSFSWTPTGADIGDHTLILTFSDSTCTTGQPIVLKSYQVVLIKVLQGVDAGPDLVTCTNADSVQLNATGPITVTQWTWSELSTGGTVGLSDPNIKNPKAFPPSTTTYVVNTNAQTACKNKDTITVTIFPGITVSAGGNHTICANDSIQLPATANPGQVNPIIDWTPGTDLSDSTTLQPWASPLVTTDYALTYIDDNGCKYTDHAIVDVNGARPVLNALSSENNVCPGYPFQLFANAASMPCGLSVFPCTTNPVFKIVGSGTVQQNQFSPYYTYWYDAYKTQILYTADELQQAGIVAGNISSIGWNVVAKGSDTMRNVKISMGCTSATDLNAGTGFLTGLSQVFSVNKYYSSLGWNNHNFQNNYFWDGVSNIVVQICYEVNGFNTNQDVVASSNTVNTMVMHQNQFGGTGCGLTATSPLIGAVRPNTRFKVCETGSFNYSWTPSSTLDNATIKDPTSSGIMNTTDFIVDVVSSSNPNCASKDTIQVIVDNSNSIGATATPAVLCEPGLVTLTGTPVGTPPQYECGEENVTCSAPFNQYFAGTGIASSTALTPLNGSWAGTRSQMLFTAAELNALGITKGRIDSLALDVTTKTSFAGFDFYIKLGCTPLTQLSSFIPAYQLKEVYHNPNYNTTVGWNNFPLQTPFVWDGIENLVVEMCFYNGQFNTIGADAVNYSNTLNPQFYSQGSNYGGCELPAAQFPGTPIISTARPNIRFSLCDIPNKVWKYRWEPGTFVFDSTAGVTTAYVNSSTTFNVFTTGGNKCEVTDSVTVTISIHDLRVTPMDTIICEGDTYQAIATGSGNAPSETFLWYDQNGGSTGLSCTNCSSPLITPPSGGDHYYTCTRLDAYNCGDTVTIHVKANPKPTVTILNGDSIRIKYEQEVNLIATGAEVYNWTPVWGTSNPNVSSMIVSPAEPTMYYVYGLNSSGCRNWDSIYVDIDYHDNLWVPTAFTPNNDGQNDIFRVANLTFQKIQEFRVMNRWGQEVFSATDNRGWNGDFKGKLQDMATFYYLIKVAYPDGATKTFKGDVTLIR
ncbi:MAG: gliding motility-associated C-terminal domain-containing protein [Chitinophagaceae bacterium]|nr:gliding motility-associated C-terminal domain-containing protein [Chitinophagaceae bacterium]